MSDCFPSFTGFRNNLISPSINSFNSYSNTNGVGTIITPILQRKKLKHREVK